ncbi:MAG: carbohydrate porin [Planctomycetota bacterium]
MLSVTPAPIATAQDAAGPGDPNERPITQRERLTGNWGGARTQLAEAGFTVEAENVLEYSEVYDGGIEEQDSFRNLFTLGVTTDLEAVAGLQGGTFFIQYLSVTAENGGSADAGDIQVFSNIENDRSLDVIYELWYEQLLFEDRLRVKVGKVDANSEFAYVVPLLTFSASGELTNSSAGFQPTIQGFPSYPDPATSINVFWNAIEEQAWSLTLGYGLYDGAAGVDGVTTGSRGPSSFFSDELSDDYFHVAEAQVGWASLAGLPEGGVSVGGWFHTGDFERFDGDIESGTGGLYATVQQRLTAPQGDEAEQGLYVFGQFGWADEDVAEIAQVYGLGAVLAGVGDIRPDDKLGVYASLAVLSDEAAAGFDRDELAIETFYRLQITPAAYLQPGLQYIVNPSGDATVDDAVVGQVRLGLTF